MKQIESECIIQIESSLSMFRNKNKWFSKAVFSSTVLGEFCDNLKPRNANKIFCIMSHQWDAMTERAGRDPRVVQRYRFSVAFAFSHEPSVASSNFMIIWNHYEISKSGLQLFSLLLAPIPVFSAKV